MSAPRVKRKRKDFNPLPWVVLVVLGVCAAVWLAARNSGTSAPKVAIVEPMVVTLPPPAPPPPPPPPPPQSEPPPEEQKEEMIEQEPVAEDEPPPGPAADEPPQDLDLGPGTPGGSGPSLGGPGGGNGIRGGTGRGSSSKFGWYAAKVQTSIREALARNSATRSAILSLQVKIWVDADGRITRSQLIGTSGDAAVDQAIRNKVFNGLLLPQGPPGDMPMPIHLRITARK